MAKRASTSSAAPQGGTTTITGSGMYRKTMYFDKAEWDAVRRRAFEEGRAYTDIVREAVRRFLDVKPTR